MVVDLFFFFSNGILLNVNIIYISCEWRTPGLRSAVQRDSKRINLDPCT